MDAHVFSILPEEAGSRLDQFLASRITELSRSRIQDLIKEGHATLNGAATKPNARLRAGDSVALSEPPLTPTTNLAQDIALEVLFEDDDLIVLNKPAGLVVHPAAGNLDGTLVNALLHHCAGRLSGIGGVARPGIVHRIDKGTSGLMVAAKTDVTHEGLAAQFARHSILRRYQAIVTGLPNPPSGTVDASVARSAANRQKMAIVAEGRGKRAVTHYRLVTPLRGASLVECRLETGRTHQVRVHMTSIGHPLLGDPAYGHPKSVHRELLNQLDFKRQALHAAELGFIHPATKESLSFKSALPSDMQELFRALTV